jgi:fatty acid synthase subunit alpha, fungi type
VRGISRMLRRLMRLSSLLFARFLAYVAESIAEDQSAHGRTALFLNLFKYFTLTYLATKDIHFLTSTFDTDTHKILSAYFLAVAALKAQEIDISIPKQESAVLAVVLSKKASIFALFGGQGTNEVLFDELQNLYDIYKPFMAPFIQALTKDVLAPLGAEEEASTHYMFGLIDLAFRCSCSPCCTLSCFSSHFIPSYRAYSAGSIFGRLSRR